jgi:hypothetical protein
LGSTINNSTITKDGRGEIFTKDERGEIFVGTEANVITMDRKWEVLS